MIHLSSLTSTVAVEAAVPESELASMEAVCDHDQCFFRQSTGEVICRWCGELLERK